MTRSDYTILADALVRGMNHAGMSDGQRISMTYTFAEYIADHRRGFDIKKFLASVAVKAKISLA